MHYWLKCGHHQRDLKLNAIPVRRNADTTTQVDVLGCELNVVDPATATIDCLISLHRGQANWWVSRVWRLTLPEVRMIQVVDMVRTWLALELPDLLAAARGRFNQDRIRRLWRLTDPGAQSPQETVLRLIVRDLADWESQYDFLDDFGRRLTTADLADPIRKVALFYDGAHHLQRTQRDYDSDVWQQLRIQGWEIIRITKGQLDQQSELRRRVQHFLLPK